MAGYPVSVAGYPAGYRISGATLEIKDYTAKQNDLDELFIIVFVKDEIYKLELRNQDPYIANISHPETGTYQVSSIPSIFCPCITLVSLKDYHIRIKLTFP